MLKWLGPRKVESITTPNGHVTDDPLAAIDPNRRGQKIYSVSRSVFLPRVALKTCGTGACGVGINPLYDESVDTTKRQCVAEPVNNCLDKSSSSGYGGSHGGSSHDPVYVDKLKLRKDAVAIVEQNVNFVKSIQVAARCRKNNKLVTSSTSSGGGTLTTIPEGKVDMTIPKPIWPKLIEGKKNENPYDSLVDETVLLYTSSTYVPDNEKTFENDLSVKEILVDLSNNIRQTIDGKNDMTPEQMLKNINDKITLSLETLRTSTEEEMRKLCLNLSNNKNVNSVIRAFSNSSSSGHSSQSSPEWSGNARARTVSSSTEPDDPYHPASASSSSGFSDSVKQFERSNQLPVFVYEDLSSVPNGVRNAMIYGTLCRAKSGNDKTKERIAEHTNKVNLLQAANDGKPSVWEQYYGVKAAQEGEMKYAPKPTDVPLFPRGRPEADFTLDVPRSEFLSKRMKADKKFRCRCRLVTSLLGVMFFILSVMAVSLMLTRGKRMFGSMV